MNRLVSSKRILIFSSIIIFVIVISLSILHSIFDIDKSMKVSEKYLNSISDGLTETVDSWIFHKKREVLFFSRLPQVKNYLKKKEIKCDLHSLFKRDYSEFESIFIADKQGNVLIDSFRVYETPVINLKKLVYWQYFKRNNYSLYFSKEIFRSPRTSKLNSTIITGVFDDKNNLLGFFGMAIDWEKFINKFVIPVKVGTSGYIAITDLQGRNIGHTDKTLPLKNLSQYEWMQNILKKRRGFQEYTFKGIKKLMAFRQSYESGWIINASINRDELIGRTIFVRNFIIILGTILLVALLFIIGYLDIFKLEKTEKELRESRLKFRILFESGSDGVFVHSIKDNCKAGSFIEVNKPFAVIFNCNWDKIEEIEPTQLFKSLKYNSLLKRVLSNKYSFFESEVNIGDKKSIIEFRLFLVDMSYNQVVMGFVRDITSRVKSRMELKKRRDFLEVKYKERTEALVEANDKLKVSLVAKEKIAKAYMESEEKYRNLIERANDGIMLIHEEKIYLVNEKMASLLQYRTKELINKSILYIIPKDLREFILTNYRKRINKEINNTIYETKFLKKDGTQIDVEINAGVINYERKPFDFIFVRDISERKKAEEEARKHQEQLVQTDKLVALGTLVSGVAHEINNPNNSIMLNVSVIEEAWMQVLPIIDNYIKENGDFFVSSVPFSLFRSYFIDLIKDVTDSSVRIKNIVESLKDFSKPQSNVLEEKVDLTKVINSAAKLIANQIVKHTNHFKFSECKCLPFVKGNFHRLEQVFINLIQNACHALNSKDDMIEIKCRYLENEKKVEVIVKDTGKGIKKEFINRIFDPFFTTKREQGGTGLGLSVSLGLIKEHKGSMDFRAKEGEGTEVTVRLPVYIEEE